MWHLCRILSRTERLLYFINSCCYEGSNRMLQKIRSFVFFAFHQRLIKVIRSLGVRRSQCDALIYKSVQIFNDYSLPLNFTWRFSLSDVVCSLAALQRLLPSQGHSRPCRAPTEKWLKLKGKAIPPHYRPGQAPTVPGSWGSKISRQSAHEGNWVVSPTHRPPLPP